MPPVAAITNGLLRHQTGALRQSGRLFQAVCGHDLEGIVAKPYAKSGNHKIGSKLFDWR
jgi:hypothetical protein